MSDDEFEEMLAELLLPLDQELDAMRVTRVTQLKAAEAAKQAETERLKKAAEPVTPKVTPREVAVAVSKGRDSALEVTKIAETLATQMVEVFNKKLEKPAPVPVANPLDAELLAHNEQLVSELEVAKRSLNEAAKAASVPMRIVLDPETGLPIGLERSA